MEQRVHNSWQLNSKKEFLWRNHAKRSQNQTGTKNVITQNYTVGKTLRHVINVIGVSGSPHVMFMAGKQFTAVTQYTIEIDVRYLNINRNVIFLINNTLTCICNSFVLCLMMNMQRACVFVLFNDAWSQLGHSTSYTKSILSEPCNVLKNIYICERSTSNNKNSLIVCLMMNMNTFKSYR